jgi:hypothetical protein
MYPCTRPARHRLAVYLITEHVPKLDVVALVESCSVGWACQSTNNMIHVDGICAFEAALGPVEGVVSSIELLHLALHIAWVGFFPQVSSMACYIQSKHLEDLSSSFFTQLYGAVAWLICPPSAITDVFQIGRPDLAEMARIMYMRWLAKVRSPVHILRGLSILKEPWDFETHTPTTDTFVRWATRCGVQFKLGPTTTKTSGLISINNLKVCSMADRDMVFVAMMFLFSAETDWCKNGVPTDAPAPFKCFQATFPCMFSAEPAPHLGLIDDLVYLE